MTAQKILLNIGDYRVYTPQCGIKWNAVWMTFSISKKFPPGTDFRIRYLSSKDKASLPVDTNPVWIEIAEQRELHLLALPQINHCPAHVWPKHMTNDEVDAFVIEHIGFIKNHAMSLLTEKDIAQISRQGNC